MNTEKQLSRLESLLQRHTKLDKDIKQGYSNYIDDEHLSKMKHEKLVLKREITILKNIIGEDNK